MEDLAKNGISTDKLKVGTIFWVCATLVFMVLSAACVLMLATKTHWGAIPAIGIGLFAFNAARYATTIGRSFHFTHRAIKKGWYQPVLNADRTKEILEDLEVPSKIVAHRTNQFSSFEPIVCFASHRDFVKYTLRN
jgi:hypothetical protein